VSSHRSLLLLSSLLLLAIPSAAQDPAWESWHGPVADGWLGLRFGMGRFEVARRVESLGLKAENSRAGTMRHQGKLEKKSVQVITDFVEDRQSGRIGRLHHIELIWPEVDLTADRAYASFQAVLSLLETRYGPPFYEQNGGRSTIINAGGRILQVYRGPEMQAVVEIESVARGRYNMRLVLDSPQLHPDLPGGG
jgi:hypothetical protein